MRLSDLCGFSPRLDEFWVAPLFPRGYCPIHTWAEKQCNNNCVRVRAAFGEVARDTEAYFSSPWYLRQRGNVEQVAA